MEHLSCRGGNRFEVGQEALKIFFGERAEDAVLRAAGRWRTGMSDFLSIATISRGALVSLGLGQWSAAGSESVKRHDTTSERRSILTDGCSGQFEG